MKISIYAYGVVVSDPKYIPPYTVFRLQTGKKTFTVLRKDPLWQKRDVIFLRRGQRADIRGKLLPGKNRILAQKIQLTRIIPQTDGCSQKTEPGCDI